MLYKISRKLYLVVINPFERIWAKFLFIGNNVEYSSFRTAGVPYVMVARGGKCIIGKNFAMNNGIKGNPIGSYRRCTFFVDRNAELIIGNNVGISQEL